MSAPVLTRSVTAEEIAAARAKLAPRRRRPRPKPAPQEAPASTRRKRRPHTKAAPPLATVSCRLRMRNLPGDEATTWLDVVHRAAAHHGVTSADVCSRRRHRSTVAARHEAWRILREAGYSTPEIARVFGVDHSSVQHGTTKRAA